ncbi:uncharacterized protein DUF3854 [Thermodesulfitimonas autotrophica]|uniref:Uncharacterized protein DUF3854 n=1 Tax=Thermodesulfitimonas autotrophica TaxID=1894989 RepID=A0A3N5BUC7_9THEO|nr:DUF3854 domain-containing protein [Thermodesulfitimonas autotrophica]RPF49485.1 uncharacterized protein DUF3854 [Thermodesulfitimonas autotrophica]
MATAAPDAMTIAQKLGLRFVKNGPGDETIFRCPFGCDDDSRPNEGHFYINARTTTCYCHKCGWKGNLLTLYAELRKVDPRAARSELGAEDEPFRPPQRSPNLMAPVEHRDRVYRTFLSVLNLDAEHKSDLLRRGLDESTIFKRGYRSVPQDPPLRWKAARFLIQRCGSLEGVPGFYLREGKKGSYWDFLSPKGYFVPVRDPWGRIQALKVRLDSGGYIWFSSEGRPKGSSSGSPPHYTGGRGPVYVTEGPLKADVAHFLSGGAPFIGTGGVHATKEVPELLKLLGASDVLVAFDADQFTNQNVRRALQDFIQELKKCGFRARSLSWPQNLGKGIDDVLLRLYKREVTSVTFLIDGVPVTVRRTVTLEVAVGRGVR